MYLFSGRSDRYLSPLQNTQLFLFVFQFVDCFPWCSSLWKYVALSVMFTSSVTLLGIYCCDVTQPWYVLSPSGVLCLLWLESPNPQTALGSRRQIRADSVRCTAEAHICVLHPLRPRGSSAYTEILNALLLCTFLFVGPVRLLSQQHSLLLYQRLSVCEKVSETCRPWLISKIYSGAASLICIIHFPYWHFLDANLIRFILFQFVN